MAPPGFHAGWTFHRAGPNQTGRTRGAMTVIYMEEDMSLAAPSNPQQEFDARTWCPEVQVGEPAAGSLNPVIWSRREVA